ncbi:hypothetical protein [Paenibacillus tundrae]
MSDIHSGLDISKVALNFVDLMKPEIISIGANKAVKRCNELRISHGKIGIKQGHKRFAEVIS